MASSKRLPIVIAGGGIGGLAAALALARRQWPVQVHERAHGPSRSGAGIQLGPNAVKMLRRLGVADAVAAVASVPEALVVRCGADGRVLSRVPLGATIARRHGAPYWVVHRADLQKVLWDAAVANPRIALISGQALGTVVTSADGAALAVTAASGASLSAAAIIGADGVWSQLRAQVNDGGAPQPSGYLAYRTLIPAAVAGVLAAPTVGAWLSPDAHVVHYLVREDRWINVVAIVRAAGLDPTSVLRDAHTWSAPAEPAEVAAGVAAFAPELRDVLAQASGWQKWTLAQPVVLPHWTRGRIALLGDAAHAMLPFFAQGGAMALEDAVVLAGCIEASADDLVTALRRYEALRRVRVARVQAAATSNGRVFHLGRPAALIRDVALRLLPPALLQRRFDWLYGFDAGATAFDE